LQGVSMRLLLAVFSSNRADYDKVVAKSLHVL